MLKQNLRRGTIGAEHKMQSLIFIIKVVLAKMFSTVLIRLHSCVNIGMRQDIGKTYSRHSRPSFHCIGW